MKREVDNITGSIRDYGYDEQGRLATVGNGAITQRHYTYDSNGNRLSTSASSTSPIAVYDAQDRLTSYDGATYKYWPNGELRSKTAADSGVTEYSSLTLDRGKKLRLYASCAIPEYWVVNLSERCIEVYTGPTPTAYSQVEKYEPGQVIRLVAFPEVSFAVADVLK